MILERSLECPVKWSSPDLRLQDSRADPNLEWEWFCLVTSVCHSNIINFYRNWIVKKVGKQCLRETYTCARMLRDSNPIHNSRTLKTTFMVTTVY